jgi:hypothetical protein
VSFEDDWFKKMTPKTRSRENNRQTDERASRRQGQQGRREMMIKAKL